MVGYGLNSYQRRRLKKIYKMKEKRRKFFKAKDKNGYIEAGIKLKFLTQMFVEVLTQRQRRLYERNNSENKIAEVYS